MAVNGKNASGRLAAATVLWLLVAIFLNQNYVFCDGEEEELDQFQPQLRQQEQQQPPTQQQQSQMPQKQSQMPQQQSQIPQQQSQMPQQIPPQMTQQTPPQILSQMQSQLPQPSPPQQQQQPQQQQRPPIQPQEPLGGVFSPFNNVVTDVQPNMNRLIGQPMNAGFGTNSVPLQLKQGESIVAGAGQIPMLSGGPPQVSTFDETNQRIQPNSRLNSQSESNFNSLPLLTNPSSGQNQYRPQAQLTEQINSAQDSMNNPQHKFIQPMPSMPYPQNRQPFTRPSMVQTFQSPFYPNSNMYEAPAPVNTPGYPRQSYVNMNMGDLLQPAQMFTNLIPTNPMKFVQTPINMMLNAVEKVGNYTKDVRVNLDRAFKEVVGQILDQGQSGTQRLLDIGSAGKNLVFDFGRKILIPDLRNQQTSDFGGRFNSPQASIPPNYGFNSNQQPLTQMGNVQPQAGAGQFMGGNSNGQPPSQGAVPLYQQQRPGLNYGTNLPVNT